MNKFIISTDTTSDLPENFIKENDIDIHPLYYTFGENTYGGANTLPEKEFYAKMRGGELPVTNATNPEVSEEYFTKRVQAGYDVLHIAFSSALSSTYNNTCLAAREVMEKYPDRKIIVIDSLSASMGEGLIVYHALKQQKLGHSIDEVAAYLQAHIENFCHYFTVDDLFHLYRGGRVSRTAAILGTLASVKPMLHVDSEGKLIPLNKVRGRKKSLIALVDSMEKLMGSYREENDIVFISHGDCLEDAQFVAKLIKERMGIDAWINYVCPTIGAHSGPGTLALFFLGERRKL